jgi:Flp pilus assembly protein protease CpaA
LDTLAPTSTPLVVTIVAACGAVSALVDLRYRRIPNPLTLGMAALGVALSLVHVSNVGVAQAFGGLAVGLLLMLPGFLLGATGGGDVKLFAALGTMLGPSRIGMAFLYTALVGAALALAIAWRRKRLATTIASAVAIVSADAAVRRSLEHSPSHHRFAYAPAIALGALVAALGF